MEGALYSVVLFSCNALQQCSSPLVLATKSGFSKCKIKATAVAGQQINGAILCSVSVVSKAHPAQRGRGTRAQITPQ